MAEVPVFQNFAVTGSLNQYGEVQPIGGVNEKIEGFWQCCKILGRRGTYNILLPEQNVVNLMLSKLVRDAIEAGRLKLYPVKHFWQVWTLMTGEPLGVKNIHTKRIAKESVLSKILERNQKIHANTLA